MAWMRREKMGEEGRKRREGERKRGTGRDNRSQKRGKVMVHFAWHQVLEAMVIKLLKQFECISFGRACKVTFTTIIVMQIYP